jgi:spermidine synthase
MPFLRSVACLVLCATSLGSQARQIYQEKSLYRNISIYEEGELRCMTFGIHNRGRQSCMSLRDPDVLVFTYTKMLLGALYLKPSPKSVLVIGLGGGTIPTTLQKILPQAQLDCVELDPSVLKVATKYFGFMLQERSTVFVEDGRVFVKRAQKQGRKYDLIILDAFDQVYIPEHMLTKEYLLEVRALLEKDGVLASNTFSSSRLYASESATYFSAFGPFYNLQMENRVILLRNDGMPPMSEIEANAARLEEKLRRFGTGKDWLLPLFRTDVQWPGSARILTDQYSPANLLNGRL